jgi:RNase adapter protein RapZ
VDLLLIGGVSGSGKSVALAAFEDAGYYTVNNLPVPLVVETADYLAHGGQERVAIALDVKTGPGLPGLSEAMAALGTRGWSVRFIYLDATVETLVKRFSETRRRHPFSSDDRTLTEAIEYERGLVAEARDLGMTFDTSEIAPAALRAWIKDFVSVDASKLTLQLESFGFKHGLPLDADLVFDARCLPNPHYDPALAPLTGRHADVVAFLESIPEVERMYGDIYHFIASWLPDYARDNRNYLTVAIGCTGGQHRSVYLIERLATQFSPRYQVLVRHRNLSLADRRLVTVPVNDERRKRE